MLKITDETPLSEVLLEAAINALGRRVLCDEDTGQRCFWGETYHLAGLPDSEMLGRESLDGPLDIPGYRDWDAGRRGQALALAIMAKGDMTVRDLRVWLTGLGLFLQHLEEPTPLIAA